MIKQERSKRVRRLGAIETLETRNLMTIAATAPLPDVNIGVGSTATTVDLDTHFKDADAVADSYAMVNTSLGTVPVLLTAKTTPVTVANFLNYATKGSYNDTIVHRSVPGFIWQTGGFQLGSSGSATTIATDPAIKNEFAASNVRGTIAMAKLGSDPNSATSQFFFNESDSNASNLDNQNGGFTVFGHVVGPQGLAVMDAVANVPVPSPGPLASPLDQIPLQNYTAGQGVQTANLVLVKSVTTAPDLFTTISDAPGVATVAINDDRLTINPVAAGTAHVAVVAYGSDGLPATQVFTVNVGGADATTAPVAATPTPTPTPTATDPVADPIMTTTTTTPTTTTTTTTATNLVAAVRPSALLPLSSHGALPASVVAGQRARIGQTVVLQSLYKPVAQRETVTLSLSPSTLGTSDDHVIATTRGRFRLNLGQQAKVKLVAPGVKANVPAGTYHVLATVTDPDGGTTVSDTGRTLTVQPARTRRALK